MAVFFSSMLASPGMAPLVLSSLLTLPGVLPGVSASTPFYASPQLMVAPAKASADDPATRDKAKGLYEEGRRAYRKGDMPLAVEKFEAAYDLTENAIILYNIGLAYRRLYDESRDIAHLRRAKVVLENFRMELARDSGLGSPDEVAGVLAEVEEMLDEEDVTRQSGGGQDGAEAETKEDPASSDEEPAAEPEGPEPAVHDDQPVDSGDPGRGLKIGGYTGLGLGGALGIGAGVVAAVFIGKKNDHLAALDESVANAQAEGCVDTDTSGVCGDYLDEREALTVNANLAQDRALLGGVALGVSAGVAIGGGVALVLIGNKKSKQGKTAHLRVTPFKRGVALSGRF